MLDSVLAGDQAVLSEMLVALSVRLFEADDREAERAMLGRAKAAAERAGAAASFALAACGRAYSFGVDRMMDSAWAELALAGEAVGCACGRARTRRPWLDRALAPGGVVGRAAGALTLELEARRAARGSGPAAAAALLTGRLPLPDTVTGSGWVSALLLASEVAAAAGDTGAARRHALGAARVARVDSLAAARSVLLRKSEHRLAELGVAVP